MRDVLLGRLQRPVRGRKREVCEEGTVAAVGLGLPLVLLVPLLKVLDDLVTVAGRRVPVLGEVFEVDELAVLVVETYQRRVQELWGSVLDPDDPISLSGLPGFGTDNGTYSPSGL